MQSVLVFGVNFRHHFTTNSEYKNTRHGRFASRLTNGAGLQPTPLKWAHNRLDLVMEARGKKLVSIHIWLWSHFSSIINWWMLIRHTGIFTYPVKIILSYAVAAPVSCGKCASWSDWICLERRQTVVWRRTACSQFEMCCAPFCIFKWFRFLIWGPWPHRWTLSTLSVRLKKQTFLLQTLILLSKIYWWTAEKRQHSHMQRINP